MVGALAISCTECSATNYLKLNGNIFDCQAACGTTHWLDSASKKCVSSCYFENPSRFRSSIAGALYKCVTACETDEFVENKNDRNPICTKCTALPVGTDQHKNATNSAYTCTKCSTDGKVCYTCSAGYLRTDKAECVQSCADEIIPAFLSTNRTVCL